RRKRWSWAGFIAALLVASGGLVAANGMARASLSAVIARPPEPGQAQPLENGPAVKPAPLYTTAPSGRVDNDPHWRSPNVRSNTDTTTYAQQEPAIAVNPLNHLNVVTASKDERRAPAPNTATKEVWMETSTDGGLTWPVQTHIP